MMDVHAPREEWPHPGDAGDLHRCLLLLRRIPEWSGRMPSMENRSDEWRALAGIWSELMETVNAEAGSDLDRWPRPATRAVLAKAFGSDD